MSLQKLTPTSDKIKEGYFDPTKPGSFGGLKGFLKHNQLKNHKSIEQTLKTFKTFTHGIDLIDMQKFKFSNRGYSWILYVIDIFSRFVFVMPLKNKKTTTVVEALKDLYKKTKRRPQFYWSDQGI